MRHLKEVVRSQSILNQMNKKEFPAQQASALLHQKLILGRYLECENERAKTDTKYARSTLSFSKAALKLLASSSLRHALSALQDQTLSLQTWRASLIKYREFVEKELNEILEESEKEVALREDKEDDLENASLLIEYSIQKQEFRQEELNKSLDSISANSSALPKTMFRKLARQRKLPTVIIPKYVESMEADEIILQRNYDKKSEVVKEMEDQILKELRWTAAYNEKIKKKKAQLKKVKRKFEKICKKYNYNAKEADKIPLPDDISESEVNAEEFNNIAVQKQLEEEARLREIKEKQFMKRIEESQKHILPKASESLAPKSVSLKKEEGQKKQNTVDNAMRQIQRIEEAKAHLETEGLDPDEIVQNYMKKKQKQAQAQEEKEKQYLQEEADEEEKESEKQEESKESFGGVGGGGAKPAAISQTVKVRVIQAVPSLPPL